MTVNKDFCSEHSGCRTDIENNKKDVADIWSTINTIRTLITEIQTGFVPKWVAIGITLLTSTMTAIIGYQMAVINMMGKQQSASVISVFRKIFF